MRTQGSGRTPNSLSGLRTPSGLSEASSFGSEAAVARAARAAAGIADMIDSLEPPALGQEAAPAQDLDALAEVRRFFVCSQHPTLHFG